MAGGPIIDVTNFIDERRFSWFQGRVLALCILLQICDGIDLQAIGYTGARIRAELHPTLGEMGWVFSAGLIGMACGALIFGPVADKIGRRAVMIISVFLFGAFSFAIAFVDNIWELMALRFCAGLGFGGALPNSLGLVAEYVPKRARYTIMGLASLGLHRRRRGLGLDRDRADACLWLALGVHRRRRCRRGHGRGPDRVAARSRCASLPVSPGAAQACVLS